MLMSTGVNFGIREGVPHFLGICIGFPAMLVVIGLGFGQIFETYPFIHEWIKWTGIGYLLYLAWKIGTSHSAKNPTQKSKPMNFWQASAFQWINPKAWIMGSSALATFTSVQSDFLIQVLLVAGAFSS
jgi:threonine/homoserine/homoserine lactone efflux protein